ncbi:MAG TPA: hypothetical protein DDW29_14050, partial [Gammaproteobacteria bacterium]|nr:hypothetical protein [Gammaproteobacteria bacterium]
YQITSVRWSKGSVELTINGINAATAIMDDHLINSTLFMLGARSDGSTASATDVAEVLVFNEALTEKQSTDLLLGLTEKYGVGFGNTSHGLIGHYKLDETTGTLAADASEEDNDGTLINMDFASQATAGRFNGALEFLPDAAANTGIDVDTITDTLPEYTLSAWIKANTTSSTSSDVFNLDDMRALRITNAGTLQHATNTTVGWEVHHTYDNNLLDDQWHHIAVSFDGYQMSRLYLDGDLLGEMQMGAISQAFGLNRKIGRHTSGGTDRLFIGLMDDARIYNRALSAAEMAAISVTTASVLPVCGSSTDIELTFSGDIDPVMATKITEFEITPYDGGAALTITNAQLVGTNKVRLAVDGLTADTLYNVRAFTSNTKFYLPASQGHHVDWTTFRNRNMSGTYLLGRTDMLSFSVDTDQREALVVDGVFVAPVTGSYTFKTFIDNTGEVWLDGKRITNDSNDAMSDSYTSDPIELTAGQKVPLRVLGQSINNIITDDLSVVIATDLNQDGSISAANEIISGQHWQNCAGTISETYHEIAQTVAVCDMPSQFLAYFRETQAPSLAAMENASNYGLISSSGVTVNVTAAQALSKTAVLITTDGLMNGTGYELTAFGNTFKLATSLTDSNKLVGQYFDQDEGAGKQKWYKDKAFTGASSVAETAGFEVSSIYGQGSDYFTTRWQGTFTPDRTDTYHFRFKGLDDGARAFVNGKLVNAQWGNSADYHYRTSDIDLVAGQHYPIRVDFLENAGSANIEVMVDLDDDGQSDDVITTDMLRTCMPVSTVSDLALVNHWALDENTGTTVNDSVGNDNLTLQGDSDLGNKSIATGIKGRALNFDGSDDRLLDNDPAVYENTDVTLSAWIKYETTANANAYILSMGNNQNLRLNGLANQPPTMAAGTRRNEDSSWFTSASATALEANRWYHVAYRFYKDSNTVDLFLNGELEAHYPNIEAFTPLTPYDISIGASPFTNEGTTSYFDGTIDDVKFFNRALGNDEVKALAGPTLNSALPFCNGTVNTLLTFDGNLSDFNANITEEALYSITDITNGQPVTIHQATQYGPKELTLTHNGLTPGHEYSIMAWGRSFTYIYPENKGYFLQGNWFDQPDSSSYFTGTTYSSQYQEINFKSSTNEPLPGVGNAEFSGQFTGLFVAPRAGQYQFRLNHAAGARVWIGGRLVIDNMDNFGETATTSNVQITLAEGEEIPVRIDMIQGYGQWNLEFRTHMLSDSSFDIVQSPSFKNCAWQGTKEIQHVISSCGMDTEITLFFSEDQYVYEANDETQYRIFEMDGTDLGTATAAAVQSNPKEVLLTVPTLTRGQAYKVQAFGQTFYFAMPAQDTVGGSQLFFDQMTDGEKVSASNGGLWTGDAAVNTGLPYFNTDGHYIDNTGAAPRSVRWTAMMTPSASGTYDFNSRSSAGVKVQVGQTQVINHWDEHLQAWNDDDFDTGSIALTKDQAVPVTIDHWDADATGHLRVQIEKPSAINAAQAQMAFSTCKPTATAKAVTPTYAAPICGSDTQLLVMFADELPADAETLTNYTIDAATIANVELLDGSQSVLITTSSLASGQTYKLKAFGNDISFVGSDTIETGLYGSYFNQMANGIANDAHDVIAANTNAAFNGGITTRLDTSMNFTWAGNAVPVTGLNGQDYSVRWQGSIQPTQSGSYTFASNYNVEEEMRLWVNNTLISDDQKPLSDTAITLEAGLRYPVRVDYIETGTNTTSNVNLQWTRNAGTFNTLTGTALSTCASPLAALNNARLAHTNSVCNSDNKISLVFENTIPSALASELSNYEVLLASDSSTIGVTDAEIQTDSREIIITTSTNLIAGETYRVKAFDRQLSYFHVPVNTAGVYTSYFNGQNYAGKAGISVINDDLRRYFNQSPGNGVAHDDMSTRTQGYWIAPQSGTLKLRAAFDDTFEPWFNGVQYDIGYTNTTVFTNLSAEINVVAGKAYPIRFDVKNNSFDYYYQVQYSMDNGVTWEEADIADLATCKATVPQAMPTVVAPVCGVSDELFVQYNQVPDTDDATNLDQYVLERGGNTVNVTSATVNADDQRQVILKTENRLENTAHILSAFGHKIPFAEAEIHGTGLMGSVYQQTEWKNVSDAYGDFPDYFYKGSSSIRYDSIIDIPKAELVAFNNLFFRWNGFILPNETGTHVLDMVSDEASKIWLDGQHIMNAWVGKGPEDVVVADPVNLVNEQPAALSIQFFDAKYDAEAHLKWTTPSDSSNGLIPENNFYTCFPTEISETVSVTPICRQNNQVRVYFKGELHSAKLDHVQSYQVFDESNAEIEVTDVTIEADQGVNLTFAEELDPEQVYTLRAFGHKSTFSIYKNNSYGLTGRYYNAIDGYFRNGFASQRLDTQVMLTTDGQVKPASITGQNYSIRWDGSFKATEAGNYRLYLEHNDGARVWANGTLILDQWHENTIVAHQSDVLTLEAEEQVAIRIEYYSNDADYAMKLQWILPGASVASPIPSESLSTCIGDFPELRHVTTYCGTYDRVLLELNNTFDAKRNLLDTSDITLVETGNPANTITVERLVGLSNSILMRTESPMTGDTQYTLTAPKLSSESITFMIPSTDHDGLFEVLYTQDGVEEDYFKGEILTNVGKNIDMPATVAGPSGYNTTDMTLESVGSNHYSARWHGYLVPTESGIHTLQSTTDDGFKLWLGDTLVIDNWHADGAAQISRTLDLTAGERYAIRAEYYEATGEASYNLAWKQPSDTGYNTIAVNDFKACSQPPDDADYPMQLLDVTAFCDDLHKLEVRFADDVPVDLLSQPEAVTVYALDGNGVQGELIATAATLTRDTNNAKLITIELDTALTHNDLVRLVFYGQEFDFVVPAAEQTGLNTLFWNQKDADGYKQTAAASYFTGAISKRVSIPLLSDAAPSDEIGATHFTARYSGIFNVPTDGDYKFTMVAEGGARLWVNGKRVLNTWVYGQSATTAGDYNREENYTMTGLTQGQQVSIRLDYRRGGENGLPQLLRLFVENMTTETGGSSYSSQFSTCKLSQPERRRKVMSVTNVCEPTNGGGVTELLVNYNRALNSDDLNDTAFMNSFKLNGTVQTAMIDPYNNTRIRLTTNALAANTLYTLTAGGEELYFMPAIDGVSGLTGIYFDQIVDGEVKTLAEFGDQTGSYYKQTDGNINFDWSSSLLAPTGTYQNFSAQWQGYIVAPATDTYSFRTRSNDGVRVWVGEALVLDNYAPSFNTNLNAETGAPVSLEQGRLYPVRVEYRAGSKTTEQLRLQWSRAGDPTIDIVPTENFKTCLPTGNTTDTFENSDVAYFGISHDNYGIYCLAENSITVAAYDQGGTLLPSFTGTIHLSTSTGKGKWSSLGAGTMENNGSDNGEATYTFAAGDMGVAKFSLDYYSGTSSAQYAPEVNIDVQYDTNASITELASLDPTLVFAPTGLLVDADSSNTMVAGENKALTLTAYGQTPEQNNCDVIETYQGAQTINFTYAYFPTLDPISVNENREVNPSIQGNEISTQEARSQTLSFTNGQAQVQLKFKDVGRIVVNATDTTNPDLGDRTLYGSSGYIVSRPDRLEIRGISEATTVDKTEPANYVAGEAFNVSIAALDAEGDEVPSFADTNEKVVLTHQLVSPAAGVPGILTGGDAASWMESSPGVMSSSVAWSEVGFISLTASMNDSTYLGVAGLGDDVTDSNVSAVGRFRPATLHVEAAVAGIMLDTNSSCGFVYQTKNGGSTAGQSMQFDTTAYPSIKVKGVNANNATTYNYASNDYWMLSTSGIRASYTNTASTNAVLRATSLAPTLASPEPLESYNSQGYREYYFENDSFVYEKAGPNELSADLPFTPAFSMSIPGLQLTDTDNVMFDPDSDAIANDFTGFNAINNGPEVRYGRIIGKHVTGTGLEPMTVTLTAQYWSSVNGLQGFVTNTEHHTAGECDFTVVPSYYTGTAAEQMGTIAESEVSFTTPTPWSQGISTFNVTDSSDSSQGIGDDNAGRVPIVVDVPDFLEYDYTGTGAYSDPKSSATVGGKNSNIIFQRQGYR